MFTEEQAKTKWCPKVQIAAAASGDQSGEWYNRPADADKFHCIGSACMAWVEATGAWTEYEYRHDLMKPPGELNPPFSNCPEGFEVARHDSGGRYQARRASKEHPPMGRCGLVSPQPGI